MSQSNKSRTLPAVTKTISAENISQPENIQPKVTALPPKPPRLEIKPPPSPQDEWNSKLSGKDKSRFHEWTILKSGNFNTFL